MLGGRLSRYGSAIARFKREVESMQQHRGAVFTHDKAHENERSDETMNGKVGENFAREP